MRVLQLLLALTLLAIACGAGFMSYYLGVEGDHQVPDGPVEVGVFFLLPVLAGAAAVLALVSYDQQHMGYRARRRYVAAILCSVLALAAFYGVFDIF